MKQTSTVFTAPRQVNIQEQELPDPPPGHVLVRSICSAISAGTERLIYQGQFPEELPLDVNIASLAGVFSYPLKYGYCNVGRVVTLGLGVAESWKDRLVFAFQPHESCFIATPEVLLPVPEDIMPQQAIFLPNMETALNLIMDGKPLIGEQVVVFGQGVVGLLTTALLSRFPLDRLVTLERYEQRRQASLRLGAHASLDPGTQQIGKQMQELLPAGADLVYEISGAPAALDQAIDLTGFNGRIIIGSWYGKKQVNLNLGGKFHRDRIQLVSSQVSSLAPELRGRWDKARRFQVAWEMLRQIQPQRLITQQFSIQEAHQAYQLIDEHPESTIQVIFTYPGGEMT